ncbi:MAG: alpha/beta hydrolase [Burkholderiales bacterium PBB1]|nr:MAG: alpha/beta hydrolase [Burkholderiales bacterium PBB1]
MATRLDWDRDGRDWPHRTASQFIDAGGLRWHVQRFAREAPSGSGFAPAPLALLLHGTGASAHSWYPMLPWLRPHLDLLLIDLPGHAYTGMANAWQASLPGMASAVKSLLDVLAVQPAIVIGHSAGAALGARMCLDGHIAPQCLVSINGAFMPLGGLAGWLFPPAAKLMAALPFAPGFVARRAADPRAIARLVSDTGSVLDAQGMALYGCIVSNPGHVEGALAMMANWDVQPLLRDLPRLSTPVRLIVADQDRAVPPAQAQRVLSLLPPQEGTTLVRLSGAGHIVHEEQPERVASLCLAALGAG